MLELRPVNKEFPYIKLINHLKEVHSYVHGFGNFLLTQRQTRSDFTFLQNTESLNQ